MKIYKSKSRYLSDEAIYDKFLGKEVWVKMLVIDLDRPADQDHASALFWIQILSKRTKGDHVYYTVHSTLAGSVISGKRRGDRNSYSDKSYKDAIDNTVEIEPFRRDLRLLPVRPLEIMTTEELFDVGGGA